MDENKINGIGMKKGMSFSSSDSIFKRLNKFLNLLNILRVGLSNNGSNFFFNWPLGTVSVCKLV